MKNILLGITIAIIFCCGNVFAQSARTDDEKSIDAFMMSVGNAWGVGDLNKYAESLTEDCVHIDPFGIQFNGREAYMKHVQWVKDNFYSKNKPSTEISDYSVRLIGADSALVTFLNTEDAQSLRMTFVLTRIKTAWKIAFAQVTIVSGQQKPA